MFPVFRYTTLAEVKGRLPAEPLADSALTDADIMDCLEQACVAVNTWTRQVFQPFPDIIQVSGNESPLTHHPEFYPFLEMRSIAQLAGRTTGSFKEMDRIIPGLRNWPERKRSFSFGYDSSGNFLFVDAGGGNKVAWDRGSRTISLITLIGEFVRGWHNIEITGWWGWQENLKRVDTTLTAEISANNANVTSVQVASVIDAATGDMLEAGDTIAITIIDGPLVPKKVELAIVKTITGIGPYTLAVDTLHPYPVVLPIGTNVRTYGRVPTGLKTVATYLAMQFVAQRIAELTGDSAAVAALNGTLKSEKTDGYSYTLATPGGDVGAGQSGSAVGRFTGSPRMDLLLRQFGKPNVAIRVI